MFSVKGIRVDGGALEPRHEQALEERLETVAWGLVFLLVGALALPRGPVEFVSVAGVGALMLGLNVARIAAGIPVGWFSAVLGATALVGGAAAIAGLRVDVFAVFFVLAGLVTIGGAAVRRG